MKPEEVIVLEPTHAEMAGAFKHALRYALISFPFTVNRMALRNPVQRILNIAKGKLAERILERWASGLGLGLDFMSGTTPFHLPDAFDFSWKGVSWDIKNNFIYHPGRMLSPEAYLRLPALVPHRHEKDQWERSTKGETQKRFLFSFIKLSDTRAGRPFFSFSPSNAQLVWLAELGHRYSNAGANAGPYTESWFWDAYLKRGGEPQVELHEVPAFVICGIAGPSEYSMFVPTGGGELGYANYTGRWYEVKHDGGLGFCGGIMHTRIQNATCPVGFLPSFQSLML